MNVHNYESMQLIRLILNLLSPRSTKSIPGELNMHIMLCSMPLNNVKNTTKANMEMQKWCIRRKFQDCEENTFLEKLVKFYVLSTEIILVYK